MYQGLVYDHWTATNMARTHSLRASKTSTYKKGTLGLGWADGAGFVPDMNSPHTYYYGQLKDSKGASGFSLSSADFNLNTYLTLGPGYLAGEDVILTPGGAPPIGDYDRDGDSFLDIPMASEGQYARVDDSAFLMLNVTVGDASGSHSELYGYDIGSFKFDMPFVNSNEYLFAADVPLQRGQTYSCALRSLADNDPDGDYTFLIGGYIEGPTTNLVYVSPEQVGVIVVANFPHSENRNTNLFGYVSDSGFNSGSKPFTLHVPRVNIRAHEAAPLNSSGAEITRFHEQQPLAVLLPAANQAAPATLTTNAGDVSELYIERFLPTGLTQGLLRLSISDTNVLALYDHNNALVRTAAYNIATISATNPLYSLKSADRVWHALGLTNGIASATLSYLTTNNVLIASDTIQFGVFSADLVPDYNRDGSIDSVDKTRLATNEVFRFWINDDDDSGAVEGNDIPGDGSADFANGQVDGVRDLIDFFPVWLNIRGALEVLPRSEYRYWLKQADGALNVFNCNSFPSSANPDLKPSAFLYSTNFGLAYGSFPVERVGASGLVLSDGFLAEILDNGRGIMLLEGRSASSAPLVLEVSRKSDNAVVLHRELPLRLSPVEDMYRWINLRPSGGPPTSTGEPANNPDALSNGTNVFFLHGFNVSANESRGWSAEIFKRLYQSGSRAKFWGMTWDGDVGLINELHYQEDVANALAVASNLYAQVHGIAGDKIVLAHSLGNMVVSGAIQDYGLSVSKYFMLDAAVATESYRPASFNDATADNYMLHEDWAGYSNKTWCSKWFELFSLPDDRERLTWKDRFSNVLSVAYNFYSSGDEIFEVYTNGTPSAFAGGLIPFHLERYAWQKQEMFKGRTILGVPILGGTDWAGWGFGGGYSMATANAATPDNLRTNAVFRHEPAGMFSSNIAAQVRNDIIAQGVPALSYAAGVNEIPMPGNRNYDANDASHKPNGWGRSGGTYNERWLHSDLKNMAYLYTYELFNELVSQGELQ